MKVTPKESRPTCATEAKCRTLKVSVTIIVIVRVPFVFREDFLRPKGTSSSELILK